MHTTRRRFVASSLAVLLSTAIGACSGGDDSPNPSCTRAALQSAGPGDEFNYFPVGLAASWSYRIDGTGAYAGTTITGIQTVGSETAYVFQSTSPSSSATELIVKRPSGVYVLSEPGVTPPMDRLFPTLVLPFPLVPGQPVQQGSCSDLEIEDADDDGKPERASMVFWLQVFSISETADLIPLGHFDDVAHVQTRLDATVRGSRGMTVSLTVTQDDWYARDVGRLVSRAALTAPGGYEEVETMTLQSFVAPGPMVAAGSVPAGAALASASPRTALDERLLRAARSAFATQRRAAP